ncbi:MAG: hypothetical protein OEY01_03125 [Desulfobulbaceae bacterium]|nr:hypothetical protein [Desulfobulbaceae bacterium]HIJ78283.1 SAM-dependent methyltransferase [Deltaproteobacteria bacterium]
MAFTLSEVVPWGRTFDEYLAMFAMSPDDLALKILGCGDGPASFNSGLTARGGRVVSIDPLYAFTAGEISRRIDETYATVMAQTRKNRDEFTWQTITSVEELGRLRLRAMADFLKDYAPGRLAGRYLAGGLPQLPFADHQFDLALCSHLLFLYSAQLSATFHLESIKELCRVARQVRIFPLLELGAKPSRHLDTVFNKLQNLDYRVKRKKVPYEFQKGGNEMMIISAARHQG